MYLIMKDLACMTNMPFYKNRPKKVKITKDEDKLLTNYKSSMPDRWDWKDENVDPLARHTIVGIIHEE
ncbi:hypothetical protein [Sulfurimonas sp.]|uniref:hypothetical protein n=1 Tax=Sulfurimonas sp. TaxID=2022749 RepID=UPI002AB30629|nr:hypothetical protein [Sulfurimonas sp.]